jgi:transposase
MVARQTAALIVAEMGTAMPRFPTADHLAAWAGAAPGHHESAGKRRSGQRRKGKRPLGVAVHQPAPAAARTKHTCVAAQDHRLAGPRGKKKAMVAVAHSMVRSRTISCDGTSLIENWAVTTLTNNSLTPPRSGS